MGPQTTPATNLVPICSFAYPSIPFISVKHQKRMTSKNISISQFNGISIYTNSCMRGVSELHALPVPCAHHINFSRVFHHLSRTRQFVTSIFWNVKFNTRMALPEIISVFVSLNEEIYLNFKLVSPKFRRFDEFYTVIAHEPEKKSIAFLAFLQLRVTPY